MRERSVDFDVRPFCASSAPGTNGVHKPTALRKSEDATFGAASNALNTNEKEAVQTSVFAGDHTSAKGRRLKPHIPRNRPTAGHVNVFLQFTHPARVGRP